MRPFKPFNGLFAARPPARYDPVMGSSVRGGGTNWSYSMRANESAGAMDEALLFSGYRHQYIPTDKSNVDDQMETPSVEEVTALMKDIAGATPLEGESEE